MVAPISDTLTSRRRGGTASAVTPVAGPSGAAAHVGGSSGVPSSSAQIGADVGPIANTFPPAIPTIASATLTKSTGTTIAPVGKGKTKEAIPSARSSAGPSSGKSSKWTHTFVTALDYPIKPQATAASGNGAALNGMANGYEAGQARVQRQSKVDAISRMDTTVPPAGPTARNPNGPISLLPSGPPQSMRTATANGFAIPLPPTPSSRLSPSPSNNPQVKKTRIPPSAAFDLSTVRTTSPRYPPERTRERVFGLKEAPTFYPSGEEFKDPMKYIAKIGEEGKGKEYGICKIVPPEGWKMPFVLDTETFRFKTRLQRLNSLEASSRARINFLDQLYMFHRQQGNPNITIPIIDHRPCDLWTLRREVGKMGGAERLTHTKAWGALARTMFYTQAHAPHLKSAYIKIIQPFEDYNDHVRSSPLAKGTYQVPTPIDSPLTPLPDSLAGMRRKFGSNLSGAGEESPVKHKVGAPRELRARSSSRTAKGSDQSSVAGGSRAGSPPDCTGREFKGTAVAGPSCLSPATSAGGHTTRGGSVSSEKRSRPVYTEADTDESDLSDIEMSGELAAVGSERDLKQDLKERKTDLVTKTASRQQKRRRVAELGKGDAPMTPPPKRSLRARPAEDRAWKKGDACEVCRSGGDANRILLCDDCDRGFHIYCLDPPLSHVPENEEWFCPACLIGTGNDYGFDEGEEHSMISYQQRSDAFREAWFEKHPPYRDNKPGKPNGLSQTIGGQNVSEHDVEAEFWRLVNSEFETVEVEYGADIHSTTHSSASPCLETQPLMKESAEAWNVNNMPILPQSLLRYIKTDISGMTVPWTYIGMLFSTFCWHNEDHYTYSVNYQHWGDTKTWYGISGADADKFETAIMSEAPELFEQQPSLMYQLVTMMSPGAIEAAGVPVYACDQRPNEFVITFPKAYHCGFNHGFNLNEAVNFALPDWLDLGYECVLRYQVHSKPPVFSHEELLITMSQHSDSIETAVWLKEGLTAIIERETRKRDHLRAAVQHLSEVVDQSDKPEEQYLCIICKAFCYLSQVTCSCTKSVSCVDHYGSLCRCVVNTRILRKRMTDEVLQDLLDVVIERATVPLLWKARFQKVLEEAARPSLKALRSLVADGDRIGYPLPELLALRPFVLQANAWVERASALFNKGRSTGHKRQRRGRDADGDVNMDMEDEVDRGSGKRSPAYILDLRSKAERLGFDCPEIGQLEQLISDMQDLQSRAQGLFEQREEDIKLKDCRATLVLGESLNVDLPEMPQLDLLAKRLEWMAEMDEIDEGFLELKDVREHLAKARECEVSPDHEYFLDLLAKEQRGEDWQARARVVVEASDTSKLVPTIPLTEVENLAVQDPDVPVSNELAIKIQQIRSKALAAQASCRSALAAASNSAKRNMHLVKRVIKSLDGKATGIIIPEASQLIEAHDSYLQWVQELGLAFDLDIDDVAINFEALAGHISEVFHPDDDVPCKKARPESDVPPKGGRPHVAKEWSCYCRKEVDETSRECQRCHETFHQGDLAEEVENPSSPFRCALCRGKDPRWPEKENVPSMFVLQGLLRHGAALNDRFPFEEYASVSKLVEASTRIVIVVLESLRPLSDRSQTEDSRWLAHWIRKMRDVPFSINPTAKSGEQIDLYQSLLLRFKTLRRLAIAEKKKKPAHVVRTERHWPILNFERPSLAVDNNVSCVCMKAPVDGYLTVKCETCRLPYHQSCVYAPDAALGKRGTLWNCPVCCVTDGHSYPFATVQCQAIQHLGTAIYVDSRATLADGKHIITQVQHSPLAGNVIRLILTGLTEGKRIVFPALLLEDIDAMDRRDSAVSGTVIEGRDGSDSFLDAPALEVTATTEEARKRKRSTPSRSESPHPLRAPPSRRVSANRRTASPTPSIGYPGSLPEVGTKRASSPYFPSSLAPLLSGSVQMVPPVRSPHVTASELKSEAQIQTSRELGYPAHIQSVAQPGAHSFHALHVAAAPRDSIQSTIQSRAHSHPGMAPRVQADYMWKRDSGDDGMPRPRGHAHGWPPGLTPSQRTSRRSDSPGRVRGPSGPHSLVNHGLGASPPDSLPGRAMDSYRVAGQKPGMSRDLTVPNARSEHPHGSRPAQSPIGPHSGYTGSTPGFSPSPALTAAGWSVEEQRKLRRDHSMKGPNAAGGMKPANRGRRLPSRSPPQVSPTPGPSDSTSGQSIESRGMAGPLPSYERPPSSSARSPPPSSFSQRGPGYGPNSFEMSTGSGYARFASVRPGMGGAGAEGERSEGHLGETQPSRYPPAEPGRFQSKWR